VGSGSALPTTWLWSENISVRRHCAVQPGQAAPGPTMHLLTSALAPAPHTPGILMGHPLQPFVSSTHLGRMHL
jgi:hypothetical protein